MVFVFLVGGRANAAESPCLQSRLQQVGGIETAATGRSSANDCMDLIDKKYRFVTLFFDGIDYSLDPFFKICYLCRPEHLIETESGEKHGYSKVQSQKGIYAHRSACDCYSGRDSDSRSLGDVVLCPERLQYDVQARS